MTHAFDRLCAWLATRIGRSDVFMAASGIVGLAVAAACVPVWREAVNLWGGALTGYVGVLLLVILQNSTNRESSATQAKLDELIRVNAEARNELIGAEQREMEEIVALREQVK
jgi:low affinity Fe/Cu permease